MSGVDSWLISIMWWGWGGVAAEVVLWVSHVWASSGLGDAGLCYWPGSGVTHPQRGFPRRGPSAMISVVASANVLGGRAGEVNASEVVR